MILAVETNFILELVLGQREANACESLLELSRSSLGVFVPAFSVAEATMVVERRRGERRKLISSILQPQLEEVNESAILARFASTLNQMKAELSRAESDEDSRMKYFRVIEAESLHVTPMTAQVLARTVDYQISGHIDLFPDALVFASVMTAMEEMPETLAEKPKFFASGDKRFKRQWCLDELRRVGCSLLSSFNDALSVARKHL